jgi:ankyrin repeat protein
MAARELPVRPSLEQYKKQAKELLKQLRSADPDAVERVHQHHPRLSKLPPSGVATAKIALADAQVVIAREHDFDSWMKFAKHIEAVANKRSAVAQFESAVDAIVTGDMATLRRVLRENPKLIRARSTRAHRATLLNYVGANGVEGFRQKTPKNAVQITEMLLDAGAEVDAVADLYGGTTTLGLVATSVHPADAGIQDALMDLLLAHGASVDGAVAESYTDGHVVKACLVNGQPEAAEFLANRGAPLDLEGAAGLGRLDIVSGFFDETGWWKSGLAPESMLRAFARACDYGRTDVVAFLLDRGIEVGTRLPDQGIFRGHTGLHLAAFGGHVETIQALLERHAPVDATDGTFGTTPTMWALYAWGEEPHASPERYCSAVELLVDAGANIEPEWLEQEKVRADPKMRAALSRRASGPPAGGKRTQIGGHELGEHRDGNEGTASQRRS